MAQSSSQTFKDIEERFGFVPPFFEVASENPTVLYDLWETTKAAYLDNPIPPLFLERLFAYLSRYCMVPYCLVCHSCFLRPLGMESMAVLDLLKEPAPNSEEINKIVKDAQRMKRGLIVWPSDDPPMEQVLFRLAIASYVRMEHSPVAVLLLRSFLSRSLYDHLMHFLCYVKSCGIWIDSHPELSYEADQRYIEHFPGLTQGEPRLIEFFANYRENVKDELKRMRG